MLAQPGFNTRLAVGFKHVLEHYNKANTLYRVRVCLYQDQLEAITLTLKRRHFIP